jgi:hypothetical protein
MIKGSCSCKRVEFELIEAPIIMGTCHCSRCRKVGSNILVIVKKDSLQFKKGRGSISTYKPEVGFKYFRNFCTNCGTSLGEILSTEDSFPISGHCFDDDPIVRNKFHEFVSSKPNWYEICDSAERFSKHPIKSN